MEQPALRVPVPKRSIATVIAAILALVIAGQALAEYLGPDRVTTEFREVRDPDNDVWTLTHVDPNDGWSDVCLIIHTCEEHPSVQRQQALCHWTADNSGCDRAYKMKEVTVVLPEATIGSDLQGCTPVDGWCTDSPTLHMEGTEPVAGQTITLIEGTRNGEPFACPGAVCDVPLLQGGNQFTFWALSSWGDSSQMGTLSAQVDSKGPKVSIPDSWYIWEPLAIQVQDDTNGIDKVTLTIDGGEYGDRSYSWAGSVVPDDFIWDRHFGEIIAPIGDYPVTVKAKDGLGNIATAHGEIVIPEPEPPAESQEASALPQSAGPVDEPSEVLAWLIDPYPLPSSGAAGLGEESGLEMAGAEDTEQQVSALSSSASAGASAQVGAVPSGTTTEGGGTGLLWGAAALAAAASATAYGLSRRRAREDYIREMRERAAEMSSPEARQSRLTSLWNAAKARVAPVRGSLIAAAAAAASLAAAEAANRRRKGSMKPALRTMKPTTPLGDEDGSPEPTPTYIAPTVTSTPPTPSANATPSVTPSATTTSTRTPTPSATPTPFAISPTNLPGTPVIEPAKLQRRIGAVVLDFIDSFRPFGEPSALDAYGWDPLTPFETAPYVGRFVPIARIVLTALATVRHLLEPIWPFPDPTYPLPEPVPDRPPSQDEGSDGVS